MKKATDREIKLYNELHHTIDKVINKLVIAKNNIEKRKQYYI